MSKIYTKTGDKGATSLANKKRVYKDNLRVEVYGSIDELNSFLGMNISLLAKNKKIFADIIQKLIKIQKDLFEIQTNLANPDKNNDLDLKKFLSKRVLENEKFIDNLTLQLPILTNFILPGGCLESASCHLTRTICRRAERTLVKLSKEENILEANLVYLNRLSDLFFTLARFSNFKKNIKDVLWLKK